MIWSLFVLSLSSHKEDRFFFNFIIYLIFITNIKRFLLPLFPFLLIFTAIGVYELGLKTSEKLNKCFLNKKIVKLAVFIAMSSNMIFLLFSGFFHKVGSLNLFDYLRNNANNIESIVFFIECHQTPYYSFLHKFINFKFYFIFLMIQYFFLK